MKKKPLHTLLPLFAAVGIVALLFIVSTVRQSASPQAQAAGANLGQLAGNAWSDTIGWISFNSTVVTVQNNGTITGYAWANPSDDPDLVGACTSSNTKSCNIGWVSFYSADTASCGATPAQISATIPADVSGWAKVLSADNEGWNGCIKLDGVTLPGGTGASGNFSGNAWGSDVVGWVVFSGVTFASSYVPPPALSVTLTANPARVGKGKTTTLYYTVNSPPSGGCTLSGNGMTPVTVTPTNGFQGSVPSNTINTATRFTLTCGSVSGSANVSILPVFIEI